MIVVQYGVAWKISKKAYKELLMIIEIGGDYDLNELGKRLGPVVEPLDWSASYAAAVRKNLK